MTMTRQSTTQLLFCIFCGLTLDASGDDATKPVTLKFEGVWRFAEVTVNGMKQPEIPFETNQLIMSDKGLYVIVQGERITHGKFSVDPSKSPKFYDVTITSGPIKGQSVAGIYGLDADTFKTCLPLQSKERPTSFEANSGSGCIAHVFKRENTSAKEAFAGVARKELAGEWQALTYALSGNNAPDEDMRRIQLTIAADGQAKATRDGQVFIASALHLDPTCEPMSIDLTFSEGELKGKTSLGIYKVDADVLTICRSAPGKARPTEFSSAEGSGDTLMTYKKRSLEKPGKQ